MNIPGEILNRFSKDMETVDSSVPEFMLQVLINWAQVFSIFALCISVTPYFVLAMIPLAIGFYKMYNYFANASRDLKRLESITRYAYGKKSLLWPLHIDTLWYLFPGPLSSALSQRRSRAWRLFERMGTRSDSRKLIG